MSLLIFFNLVVIFYLFHAVCEERRQITALRARTQDILDCLEAEGKHVDRHTPTDE